MSFPTPKLEIAPGPSGTAYAGLTPFLAPANWWRLNETSGSTFVEDSPATFPNNLRPASGTVTYGVAGAQPGDPDTALGLSGTTGLVSSNAGNFQVYATSTLEMWFQCTILGAARTIAGIKGTAVVAGTVRVWIDSANRLNLDAYPPTGTGTISTFTGGGVSDTAWHHLVVTCNLTTGAAVYLDGTKVIQGNTSAGFGSSLNGTLYVGADSGANASTTPAAPARTAFDGNVDEVVYYSKLLTDAQISERATLGAAPAPTWIDISDRLISGSETGGRQAELDTMEPITLTLTLDNTDGTFDPSNQAGPFYRRLFPAQMRLSWTLAATGITYQRFLGFVEDYIETWEPPQEATVEVTLTDGTEQLALANISSHSWAAETPGARINHALDAAQWPKTLRAIDNGVAQIVASSFTAGSFQGALAHIQDVADADFGYFFIDQLTGYATFHDQNHRATHSAAPAAYFGDQPDAGLPYESVVVDYSLADVINSVSITTADSVVSTATDLVSIGNYRERGNGSAGTYSRSSIAANGSDGQAQAQLILAARKDPAERIEQLALAPAAVDDATSDALWLKVLTLRIGDRVTVLKTMALASGGQLTFKQDCFIEAIADDFAGDVQWTTTYQLSTAGQGYFQTITAAPVALIDRPYFPIGLRLVGH